MKTLILMRHAKAEPAHPTADDFARDLAPRGLVEAEAAASGLSAAGLAPDVAVVSGAARTRQTWAQMAPTFAGARVVFSDALYLAPAPAIFQAIDDAIAEVGEADTVLAVGHNPGLKDAARDLLDASAAHDPDALSGLSRGLPTSWACVFEMPGRLAPRVGRFARYFGPPRAGVEA